MTSEDENDLLDELPNVRNHMIDDHIRNSVQTQPNQQVHSAIKRLVKMACHQSKYGSGGGIGTLPAGVERMIGETLKPAYDFRPYLRRFTDGVLFSHHESTRKRPNRRFRYLYPGKKAVMRAKIGVLADTSGSMDDEELAMIATNLVQINEHAQVILFEVDTAIHNLTEYNPKRFANMFRGGGGTVFEDVFKVIDDYKNNKHLLNSVKNTNLLHARSLVQEIQALIIITDGEVCVGKKPRVPVMWALTQRCGSPPAKWGVVCYLDNDPEKHRRE